jgi:hypothetical protein
LPEVPQEFFLNAETQMMMGQIFNGMKTANHTVLIRHKKKLKRAFFMSILFYFLLAFILITSTMEKEIAKYKYPTQAGKAFVVVKMNEPRIIEGRTTYGTANCIMIRTEITTAVIMIYKAPGTPLVIPTAVRILSNEKTRSIIMICKSTL